MKVDVTERAQEELKKVIQSKDVDKDLRIYIAAFG
jgi:Fe-S cluster assembly iron-binding protein IscA